MTLPPAPMIPLLHGGPIPQIGLGTWPLTDATVQPVIRDALEIGYRQIDSATRYGNEAGVGAAVRAAAAQGLPREQIFVTTKLDGQFQGADKARAGLEAALQRMQLDYVDLLLIHWPLPQRDQYVSTWRTFEQLLAAGQTRAIGVSNFKPAHLERLAAETRVVPAVNQIQLSPVTPQRATRQYCAEHGIVVQCYSPIGGAGSVTELLRNPDLVRIAQAHGRSTAQIVLRWHVQQGLVPLPKSASAPRLRENFDIFNFTLTDAEMALLAALDGGPDAAIDSDTQGH